MIIPTIPVLAGAPGALRIFDVVFFIVVVNALIPGATVGWVTRRLGLDAREVQSPTFALLREHDLPPETLPGGPGGRLAHLDLYRLSPDEAVACGFEEVLLGPGVKIVEWAERLPFAVPGALCLALRDSSEGLREIVELAAQPGSQDGPNL